MNIYYLFDLFLISRLYPQFFDNPLNFKKLIIKILINFLGLIVFIQLNISFLLYLIILVFVIIIFYLIEKRKDTNIIRLYRLIEIFVVILLLQIFCSSKINLNFNYEILRFLFKSINPYLYFINFLQNINLFNVLVIFMGILIISNEVNLLIRYILHENKLEGIENKLIAKGNDEFLAGRIIGILERLIIFVLLLLD